MDSNDDGSTARPPEPEEAALRGKPPRKPPQLLAVEEWPGGCRYAVIGAAGVVGYTDLEHPLAWRRAAAGFLERGPAYDEVRDVFLLYASAAPDDRARLRRFVRERAEIGLTLNDGGTLPMAARIELISEWADGRIAVHVAIRDERYWGRWPVRRSRH